MLLTCTNLMVDNRWSIIIWWYRWQELRTSKREVGCEFFNVPGKTKQRYFRISIWHQYKNHRKILHTGNYLYIQQRFTLHINEFICNALGISNWQTQFQCFKYSFKKLIHQVTHIGFYTYRTQIDLPLLHSQHFISKFLSKLWVYTLINPHWM